MAKQSNKGTRTRVKRMPAHKDHIRIVPIHVPRLVSAPRPIVKAAPAKLTYRGGPLISAVQVFTVFWGAAWKKSPQTGLLTNINQFFSFILSSPLMTQMGEYKVTGKPIGSGSLVGTVTLTSPAPAKSITDTAIQAMLTKQISSNSKFPKPNPNMLYFVYLPPGVTVVMGGSKSCQAFCGYHDAMNAKTFYAVMPYPGCQGCLGGLSALDALTSTSSHELCEAITDPVPGQGWYDDTHGEIGDICAWTTKKIGAYTVQLEWSNKAKKCV